MAWGFVQQKSLFEKLLPFIFVLHILTILGEKRAKGFQEDVASFSYLGARYE